MSRFARKKDGNHRYIVNAFIAFGCTVVTLDVSTKNVPDLLVGKGGVDQLVEVKPDMPETHREHCAEQRDWANAWRGRSPVVVRNLDDVLNVVRKMRGAI